MRREQIEEASGNLWIRVVCNVCDSVLDVLSAAEARERDRIGAHVPRVAMRPPRERAGGEF